MSADTGASLSVLLHPLVLLNINDHHVRRKGQTGKTERVIGVLLGEQKGRRVEICTSFELVAPEGPDGVPVINKNFLKEKRDKVAEVFREYDVLGWYTTGTGLNDSDRIPHKVIMAYNESPLVLVMNPEANKADRRLPVTIFESVIHFEGDNPIISFQQTQYEIESEESERICVDHVTHVDDAGGSSAPSTIIKQVNSYRVAVTMLQQRIDLIREYLRDVEAGKRPRDNALLRSILNVCHKLPAMGSDAFAQAYNSEYHDALLVAYLGTLTKGCTVFNELTENFNAAYPPSRLNRRGHGSMSSMGFGGGFGGGFNLLSTLGGLGGFGGFGFSGH